jgi:uncharacterized membrane protein
MTGTTEQPAATLGEVRHMAARLRLDATAYRRAVAIAGLQPDGGHWRSWLDRVLLALGVALVVAGVATLVAWNWAALPAQAKFLLLQAGIVAGVVTAAVLGLDSAAGRASLLAGACLIGLLFALFGQVYQTGADPYGLFLAWAVAVLPLALVGRQQGLWLLWLAVVNVAAILFYIQVLHPPDGWWTLAQLLGPLVWLGSAVTDATLATGLFVLNAAALVAWEAGSRQGVAWMRTTLFPRLVGATALATVVAPTLVLIVAPDALGPGPTAALPPLWMALATALCLHYYRHRRRDLFLLTCALSGLILVVTSLAIRALGDSAAGLLVVAALLVAAVAAAAGWLRLVARGGEAAS